MALNYSDWVEFDWRLDTLGRLHFERKRSGDLSATSKSLTIKHLRLFAEANTGIRAPLRMDYLKLERQGERIIWSDVFQVSMFEYISTDQALNSLISQGGSNNWHRRKELRWTVLEYDS